MLSGRTTAWRQGALSRSLALLAALILVLVGELGADIHAAHAVSPPPALGAASSPPASVPRPKAPVAAAVPRPNAPAPAAVTAAVKTVSRAGTSSPARTPPQVSPPVAGYGCQKARAYLATHAAPGFEIECPGDSLGHQAMTCVNVAGVCAGRRVIAITDPCPAAYENEASNSWVLLGIRRAPIDPYGDCG